LKKYLTTTNLTVFAVIFHLIGLVGIGVLHNSLVRAATPYHLLLMFLLLLLSYGRQFKQFAKWVAVAFVAGFAAEWVGVHTGWLFGHYSYTAVLGARWQQVPWLIGCNWAIVVSGAVCLSMLVTGNKTAGSLLAALLATGYDFVLEPMAIKLGYWQWSGHHIPVYNYVCWFGLSFILAWCWHNFKVRFNQFPVNLFVIQVLFFAVLQMLM
jgi:putative membrane protein